MAEGFWATTCKQCGTRYTWESERCLPIPACPRCSGTKLPQERVPEVKQASTLAEEICDLAEEVPAAGTDFAESVSETARDIAANVETHNRATDSQLNALENMLHGLQRWFHD